jgi:hypothetical protein
MMLNSGSYLAVKKERSVADQECLHCEINDLVSERLEAGNTNLVDHACAIAESLAEVILLADETEHARLIAEVLAVFGRTLSEKAARFESGEGATH